MVERFQLAGNPYKTSTFLRTPQSAYRLTAFSASLRLLCPSGARLAMSEPTGEFGAGRAPPGHSTPFRGERVPVGGRSPVENSAVASDIAERAPPAHSNRAGRRDRWCEPFSAVASGAKRRKPWLSWRIVLHRPNRQVRPLLGVPHRGTATEPTGEKAKRCVLKCP